MSLPASPVSESGPSPPISSSSPGPPFTGSVAPSVVTVSFMSPPFTWPTRPLQITSWSSTRVQVPLSPIGAPSSRYRIRPPATPVRVTVIRFTSPGAPVSVKLS
jgi:hypothetical protein